jgi:hypothetical protein
MTAAEADGNRTRLTEMLGHNGFEDRAHHQTRNASTASLVLDARTGMPKRRPAERSDDMRGPPGR